MLVDGDAERLGSNVLRKISETIAARELIPAGGHVVVGLSGGPDSLCLFHALLRLRAAGGFTVSAVHVNHKFRVGAADADQRYAEDLCARENVPLLVRVADVTALARERKETPEEAGRTVRYRAFDEAASEVERTSDLARGAIRIAVAQNRNDQAETVLMRILRGSGPDGLAAIPYRRLSEAGYEVIRPLLAADRDEIEAYCADNGLSPRRDRTNEERRYFRNRIRLHLLPLLRSEYNASIDGALLRLARIAGDDKDYFDARVREIIEERCLFSDARMRAEIELSALADAHPAIRHRLVIGIFEKIGLVRDVGAAHIEAADRLIETGGTGKSADFPAGYRLAISYDRAVFSAGSAGVAPEETHVLKTAALETGGTVSIRIRSADLEFRFSVRAYSPSARDDLRGDADVLFLDFDALRGRVETLTLRTRRAGDRISPEGMAGRKKLQDIFVDKKAP
ncbi:MAG: tRNA lysidine(34) synthetase TilS, partial [Clostridiales Family XIII bacterium]|nr:tRNA lysidine(34) synthetase TilS [Clostridiales Family XIII bacterium]